MNIYYVYAYLRKESSNTASASTPYYIGKGSGKRAWKKHAYVPVPIDPALIVICENNLTEIGALAIERRLIKWYGRKDLGTGILNNRTDGGDGVSGKSEEIRKQMSKIHSGKIVSEETRKKKSQSSKGQIPWNKGKKNVQVAWNKGLKKENDERVAQYSKTLTGKSGHTPWNKDIVGISEETRIKMKKSAKNRPPISEETRKKLSEAMKKVRASKKLNSISE